MKGYVYQTEFARKYVAEGHAEGLVEGRTKGRAEGLVEGLARGRIEGLAEGLTKGVIEGLTEGLTRGRAEEAARNLLAVLRARGMAVPDAVRERILAQKDPERLERWLEKAAVASSVAAVLDEPN